MEAPRAWKSRGWTVRAAVGISFTFRHSFFPSGDPFTGYVHVNMWPCRDVFSTSAAVGGLFSFWRGLPQSLNAGTASASRLAEEIRSGTILVLGGVVEWLMAPVLKTGRAQALVGSNPTPSASKCAWRTCRRSFTNVGTETREIRTGFDWRGASRAGLIIPRPRDHYPEPA